MTHVITALTQALDPYIYTDLVNDKVLRNESEKLARSIASAVFQAFANNDQALAELILDTIESGIKTQFEIRTSPGEPNNCEVFTRNTLLNLSSLFVSHSYKDSLEFTDSDHAIARKHLPALTNYDWAYRMCWHKQDLPDHGIHNFYLNTEPMSDRQRMHYLLADFDIYEDKHGETFQSYYATNTTLQTLIRLAHSDLPLYSNIWTYPSKQENFISELLAVSSTEVSRVHRPDADDELAYDAEDIKSWVDLSLKQPDITKVVSHKHNDDLLRVAQCSTIEHCRLLHKEFRARSLGPSSRSIERHIEQLNWEVSTRRALINRLNDFCANDLESSKLNVAIYPAIFEAFKPEPRQRPGAAGNSGAVIDDTKIPQLLASTEDISAINNWLTAFLRSELNDEFFMQRAIQFIGAHMPATTIASAIKEFRDHPKILSNLFIHPFGSADFSPQLRAEQIRLVVQALDEHVPLWNGYSVPGGNMTWEQSVAGWMYSQHNTYDSQLVNAYHKILNEERRTTYAKIVPTDNESSTGSFEFFQDYRL